MDVVTEEFEATMLTDESLEVGIHLALARRAAALHCASTTAAR